jgi:hypothetical protein
MGAPSTESSSGDRREREGQWTRLPFPVLGAPRQTQNSFPTTRVSDAYRRVLDVSAESGTAAEGPEPVRFEDERRETFGGLGLVFLAGRPVDSLAGGNRLELSIGSAHSS